MKPQKLLSYTRRACDEYGMIRHGDRIAVAVSGGKDSLAMLVALSSLRRFYPNPFSLEAIMVSLGFPGFDPSPVADMCAELGVPFHLVETDIGAVVFDVRKEKNPCALCSNLRKGALNAEALRLGCDTVALGHNRDDICQSFFMSLFYEGRVHTCAPVTYLDRTGLHTIRPLMFAPEDEIADFASQRGLPVLKSPCPADGRTKREFVKRFMGEQEKAFDHFSDKVFTAILRSGLPGYAQRKEPRKGG